MRSLFDVLRTSSDCKLSSLNVVAQCLSSRIIFRVLTGPAHLWSVTRSLWFIDAVKTSRQQGQRFVSRSSQSISATWRKCLPIQITQRFHRPTYSITTKPTSPTTLTQKKRLFKRGVKYPNRVRDSSKSATSIMFCGSADGTMLPSYVVYKSEHLWSTWTEVGLPNTRYNRSQSGWFDLHCFSDWFETVFVRSVSRLLGRKVIIGDNLSSHFSEVLSLAAENDISFVCLPPNATHLAQPLDMAFYGPLKRNWHIVIDD